MRHFFQNLLIAGIALFLVGAVFIGMIVIAVEQRTIAKDISRSKA